MLVISWMEWREEVRVVRVDERVVGLGVGVVVCRRAVYRSWRVFWIRSGDTGLVGVGR